MSVGGARLGVSGMGGDGSPATNSWDVQQTRRRPTTRWGRLLSPLPNLFPFAHRVARVWGSSAKNPHFFGFRVLFFSGDARPNGALPARAVQFLPLRGVHEDAGDRA